MILNLKKFNQHIPYQHFKMNTFEKALTLIRNDMFMCTSDIKHAYYSVPVAEEHRKFFRFQWRGNTCCPNGYCLGPHYLRNC